MVKENDSLLSSSKTKNKYQTVVDSVQNDLIAVQDQVPNEVDLHMEEMNKKLGKATLPLLIFCLCCTSFLAALDGSIVATIYNVIGTEFKSSNLSVWIMTSYLLSSSALQPIYAKLSEIFGRKTILVYALTFFLLGSIACGAANSMLQLSISRALAGLGGGGLFSFSAILIHDLVPIQKRGQYQSIPNVALTLGSTIGAPLGGFITDNFGWRYCFYLNIPPCLFVLYIYIFKLNNYNLTKDNEHYGKTLSEKFKVIDYFGALLLFIANISFVAAVSCGGNTHEWSDPLIITLLIISPIFFISFGIYELKWARNPLVSKKIIKNRNCIAVCLNNFFLSNATMTLFYIVPQYFIGVLGYSPTLTGAWMGPRACSVAIGCLIAGRYLTKNGKYYKFLIIITAFNVFGNSLIYSWKPGFTPLWFCLMSMSIEGYTFGSDFVTTMVALVADIEQKDSAAATTVMFLSRSSGWLLGGAISGGILQSKLKQNLIENIKGPEAEHIIEFVRKSITEIRTLSPEIQVIVINALQNAIHTTATYALIASILCFSCTFFLKNCDLRAKSQVSK